MNYNKYYICAIVKDEQLYFYDWVRYHLLKGITNFVIYNNGESEYDLPSDFDTVEFISWPSINTPGNPQVEAYNDFLKKHREEALALFIDVDEFLWGDLPLQGNIVLEDVTFDANGSLFYENKPVYERFKREAVLNMTCNLKTVVDLMNPGIFISCHRTNAELRTIDGELVLEHNIPHITSRKSYLRHYLTKSLEEYLQKMKRGNITKGLRTIDYFFKVNPDMIPKI